MDVHHSAAQEQRYTNPRQEKAVAEVSRAQLLSVLKDFFIVQSVNEHGSEGVEAWEETEIKVSEKRFPDRKNISKCFFSTWEQLKLVFMYFEDINLG